MLLWLACRKHRKLHTETCLILGVQERMIDSITVSQHRLQKSSALTCVKDYSSAHKRVAEADLESRPPKLAKQQAVAVFTKKEVATYKQQVKILDWHHANGKNQTKTAKHFDTKYPNLKIKQPLVSSWLKQEQEICQHYTQDTSCSTSKHMQQTTYPDVTEALELWIAKAMEDGIFLSGKVLCQKWTAFADLAGIPEDSHLSLTNGWLDSVKKWSNLKLSCCHGKAGSADPVVVAEERDQVWKITQDYKLKDIYNGDESALFYGSVGNHYLYC